MGKIQVDHRIVVRYAAEGSPLRGLIRLFYQQGSVAIGATIRAKFRFEGFDIDIIVELMVSGMTPCEVLDLVYKAVRGEKGARYYDMTTRQSRCVTITLGPKNLISHRRFSDVIWRSGWHLAKKVPDPLT